MLFLQGSREWSERATCVHCLTQEDKFSLLSKLEIGQRVVGWVSSPHFPSKEKSNSLPSKDKSINATGTSFFFFCVYRVRVDNRGKFCFAKPFFFYCDEVMPPSGPDSSSSWFQHQLGAGAKLVSWDKALSGC